MSQRPIGVDLFAGAGGLSLGFEQAGFDVLAAVEYDPIHAATHTFNFPNCTTIARSVIGLSGDEIRSESRIGNRPVDVVFGGAPCQGFSLIGKRALDDPRNSLVKEYVRIVRELDANYFVFENVKGLTVGKHKGFLREVIADFDAAGYSVVLPWRVLNAGNYAVPQDRQRLFLLGARHGLTAPHYPTAISALPGDRQFGDLRSAPTCFDALADLPDAERFASLLDSDEVSTTRWGPPSAYAKLLRGIGKAAWYAGYSRDWDRTLLTASRRTEHTEISRRRFAETDPGSVEPISRFFRLSREGLSNTLRAGTDAARGAFTSPRPIHYSYARCITVREMARLHGFPDWFRFHSTKWHGARQIGNAVPPPLGRSVAAEILTTLGHTPTRPSERLVLGDPELLHLDMSQAARRFGVEKPIGRRDRKSGARKRKQSDIEALRVSSISEERHA